MIDPGDIFRAIGQHMEEIQDTLGSDERARFQEELESLADRWEAADPPPDLQTMLDDLYRVCKRYRPVWRILRREGLVHQRGDGGRPIGKDAPPPPAEEVIADLQSLTQYMIYGPPEQANGGEEEMLSGEEEAEEPGQPIEMEERHLNAWFEGRQEDQPLVVDQVYQLHFNVAGMRVDSVLEGETELPEKLFEGVESIDLTIVLTSDDFEIHPASQVLTVPRARPTEFDAIFQVKPTTTGMGTIHVVVMARNNFVKTLVIRVPVIDEAQPVAEPAPVEVEETFGRPLAAAFFLQPRDVDMLIQQEPDSYKCFLKNGVGTWFDIPLTLPQVEHLVNEARSRLLSVVRQEVRAGGQPVKIYQKRIDIPSQVSSASLRELADIGYRLFEEIFYGPAADQHTNQVGDNLREISRQERQKIQIFSHRFFLPWGLIYVGDDPDDPDPEAFWGFKHVIEHIPLQHNMRGFDEYMEPNGSLRLSFNVNTGIDRAFRLTVVKDQREYFAGVPGLEMIPREHEKDVLEALQDPNNEEQVLYFFCHARSGSLDEPGGYDGSALQLTKAAQALKLGDLKRKARKPLFAGVPLIFINACESADLSPMFYDGFVPFFMAKGARGVIGTECQVPALFAARFAVRFFEEFFQGQSLGEVMLKLRREFLQEHENPLGLLYAVYCSADTRLAQGLGGD